MRHLSVLVVGPESSGSKLVARIIAHVLGLADYEAGEWDGSGWCGNEFGDGHRVGHRSMPYLLNPPLWPDTDQFVAAHAETHDCRFVLTTRDRSFSELSRTRRFNKSARQVSIETSEAIARMSVLLRSEVPAHVVSYETLMLLEGAYLEQLYAFLDIRSEFLPELRDGNATHFNRRPRAQS